MKHTSKLAYLLGLPVLAGLSALCTINIVKGDVSIRVPSIWDLHRAQLHSLYLGKTGDNVASVKLEEKDNQLIIRNGLIMGQNSNGGVDAFVFVGGGQNNSISSGSNSGIGGGSNNKISSSSSVIGGGNGNSISGDDSQVNVIAGGNGNKAQAGGTVVGGMNNGVNGTGAIIGGYNNKIEDGSLALGNNSEGGKGTFLWNGSRGHDYSAVIRAPGGVLIGTYDPVTGVNLVVDGAIKIGTNQVDGAEIEIKMQNGCFCAFDGSRWHAINKGLEEQCDCNGSGCVLAGKEDNPYVPGDTVIMYKEAAGLVCQEVILQCRPDGKFWCFGESCSSDVTSDGSEYYSYCNIIGEADCGNANGRTIVDAPTTNIELCHIGTLSGEVNVYNDKYTWTCKHSDKSVECSANREYPCGTGDGYPEGDSYTTKRGPSTYSYSSTPKSWTYVAGNGALGACQWRCAKGYSRTGNDCVGKYSCKTHGEDTILFNNSYKYHVERIKEATGANQFKTLYRTVEEAKEHSCSYVCTGGFVFLPADSDEGKRDRCAVCRKGTEVWTGENKDILWKCEETMDICPDDYTYDGSGQCVAYGHCMDYYGNAYDIRPENSNLSPGTVAETVARPIGENKFWTAVSSGNYHDHSCEYVCSDGYIQIEIKENAADNEVGIGVGCDLPYCYKYGGSVAGRSSYYSNNKSEVIENPNSHGTNRSRQLNPNPRDPDIGAQKFREQYSKTAGCYYYCPISRLCQLDRRGCPTNDQNYWTCYAGVKDKEDNCKLSSSCGSPGGTRGQCQGAPSSASLVGYARFDNTSPSTGVINFNDNSSGFIYRGTCSEGCLPGSEYTGATINNANVGVCWQKCTNPNHYFDYSRNQNDYRQRYKGGCKTCGSNLLRPNPNTGEWILGNPANCVSVCDRGYSAVLRENGKVECIPTYVDIYRCPQGSIFVGYSGDNKPICRSQYDTLYQEDGTCPEGLTPVMSGLAFKCGCNDPFVVKDVGGDDDLGSYFCGCPEGYTEDGEGESRTCVCPNGHKVVGIGEDRVCACPENSVEEGEGLNRTCRCESGFEQNAEGECVESTNPQPIGGD